MAEAYDIPLAEAQINWATTGHLNLPSVEVVGANADDDDRYDCSWGACNIGFSQAGPAEQLQMLLAKFAYIATVDRVPPKDVHRAFSVIPEYRQAIKQIGWTDISVGMG